MSLPEHWAAAHIAALEAKLAKRTRERQRDQEIYKSISDNYFQSVMSPEAYEALKAELAARTRERDEWESRAGVYMSERDAERERREAAEAILRDQLDYGYFRENVHAYFARYPHSYDKD